MKPRSQTLLSLVLALGSAALAQSCSTPRMAKTYSQSHSKERTAGHVSQIGRASWYGKRFQGRRTASGARFDMNRFTCAHPFLPFGTKVRITNLSNGSSIVATVNDRGPYAGGRIVDVSYRAAKELGFVSAGTAKVKLEELAP